MKLTRMTCGLFREQRARSLSQLALCRFGLGVTAADRCDINTEVIS